MRWCAFLCCLWCSWAAVAQQEWIWAAVDEGVMKPCAMYAALMHSGNKPDDMSAEEWVEATAPSFLAVLEQPRINAAMLLVGSRENTLGARVALSNGLDACKEYVADLTLNVTLDDSDED